METIPLTVQEFLAHRRENPSPLVIDLRDPQDFADGHLGGARSLPWRQLAEEAIFFSPSKSYLFYSDPQQSGLQETLGWLLQRGFRQVGYTLADYSTLVRAIGEDPNETLLSKLPPAGWNQAIEQVLDQRLRPYLESDGGGIEFVALEGDKLFVHFTGACKSCDASRTATLRLIQVSLSVALNHDFKVIAKKGSP